MPFTPERSEQISSPDSKRCYALLTPVSPDTQLTPGPICPHSDCLFLRGSFRGASPQASQSIRHQQHSRFIVCFSSFVLPLRPVLLRLLLSEAYLLISVVYQVYPTSPQRNCPCPAARVEYSCSRCSGSSASCRRRGSDARDSPAGAVAPFFG